MRYTELICLSVILGISASLFSGFISQISRMDRELEELRKETSSMVFISEYFTAACQKNDCRELEEWKKLCGALWKLESIEWESFGEGENQIFCGSWKGETGSCQVYAKRQVREIEREK